MEIIRKLAAGPEFMGPHFIQAIEERPETFVEYPDDKIASASQKIFDHRSFNSDPAYGEEELRNLIGYVMIIKCAFFPSSSCPI